MGDWLGDSGAGTYGEALGDQGMADYRRLITEAWQRNPTGHERFLLHDVLQATGDVDALIDLYAADLGPRGRTHLMIAQELDRAGRADEALDWAERGLRETADGVSALAPAWGSVLGAAVTSPGGRPGRWYAPQVWWTPDR